MAMSAYFLPLQDVYIPWLIPKHKMLKPIMAGQTEKLAMMLQPKSNAPSGIKRNPPSLKKKRQKYSSVKKKYTNYVAFTATYHAFNVSLSSALETLSLI
jgi:succinate dehydrogenase/fumarate reductase flavoprotein subunit